MKKLEGTQTQKNLMKAFLGESDARNRYTYYSSVAKKEGYVQISNIFLETADNESQHAKQFFKFIGNVAPFEVCAALPVGMGDTLANLQYGFEGEHEENTILYPGYAKVAYEEGFEDIGRCFEYVTTVEKHHEARYRTLYQNLLNNMVFSKLNVVNWICLKCGYIHTGEHAAHECPLCHHPQAYYQMLCDNY